MKTMVKNELKNKAVEIRNLKAQIKEKMRNHDFSGHHQFFLFKLKREYRHRHIAYCLLKGRTYKQIETKCAEDNDPNKNLIEKYKTEYIELFKQGA